MNKKFPEVVLALLVFVLFSTKQRWGETEWIMRTDGRGDCVDDDDENSDDNDDNIIQKQTPWLWSEIELCRPSHRRLLAK
jgi:hypothetical protein